MSPASYNIMSSLRQFESRRDFWSHSSWWSGSGEVEYLGTEVLGNGAGAVEKVPLSPLGSPEAPPPSFPLQRIALPTVVRIALPQRHTHVPIRCPCRVCIPIRTTVEMDSLLPRN